MPSRRRRALVATGVVAGVGVVGAVAVLNLFRVYTIPSAAMEPAIHVGDRIWARAISGAHAHRGDVVLLSPPKPDGLPGAGFSKVVERVVAVGGDTVEAAGGSLIVNGAKVPEPYLAPGMHTPDIARSTVPPRSVYVLGDNRINSQGSRVYGPVPFGKVSDRVVKFRAPSSIVVIAFGGVLCLPLAASVALTRRRASDG